MLFQSLTLARRTRGRQILIHRLVLVCSYIAFDECPNLFLYSTRLSQQSFVNCEALHAVNSSGSDVVGLGVRKAFRTLHEVVRVSSDVLSLRLYCNQPCQQSWCAPRSTCKCGISQTTASMVLVLFHMVLLNAAERPGKALRTVCECIYGQPSVGCHRKIPQCHILSSLFNHKVDHNQGFEDDGPSRIAQSVL